LSLWGFAGESGVGFGGFVALPQVFSDVLQGFTQFAPGQDGDPGFGNSVTNRSVKRSMISQPNYLALLKSNMNRLGSFNLLHAV
jgi:hypothetical protein